MTSSRQIRRKPGRPPGNPAKYKQARRIPVDPNMRQTRDKDAKRLSRLKPWHHAMVKMHCMGTSAREIGEELGKAEITVHTLLEREPLVKELIEHYRASVDEVYMDFHERSEQVAMKVIDKIEQKLDGDDDVNMKDLNDVYKSFSDRTGHAPVTAAVQVNVAANMGERLESARARAKEQAMLEAQGKVIDHEQ